MKLVLVLFLCLLSDASDKKTCQRCKEPATKRCSRCKNADYCSIECQTNDWPTHKKTCINFTGKIEVEKTDNEKIEQCVSDESNKFSSNAREKIEDLDDFGFKTSDFFCNENSDEKNKKCADLFPTKVGGAFAQITELSDVEAEDLKKKFKSLTGPQEHSKQGELDVQFLNHLPKVLNKMQKNDLAALRQKNLCFVLEKRNVNERQRLLQKFKKTFEFGGRLRKKNLKFGHLFGGPFDVASNNLLTFPGNGINFYVEEIKRVFRAKKILFQLHWKCKSFPLLVERKNKKFLFKYLDVSFSMRPSTTGQTPTKISFFYYNVNDPTDRLSILFDSIIFNSKGKRPEFELSPSQFQNPYRGIAQSIQMLQDAVWFDAEEIEKAVYNEKV